MADGTLETARLILRPPVAGDLPFLLEQMNTLAVLRYLGGELRTPEEVESGLAADIAAFANGEWRRWTVFVRDTGQAVGRCGLFRIRSDAAPQALQGRDEIGWTLAERYWGNGYATEAASGVLDYAFGPLGMADIFSETSDSNRASTRMMHRLGFTHRPELGFVDPDYPPQDNPTTVWSLAAEDWRKDG